MCCQFKKTFRQAMLLVALVAKPHSGITGQHPLRATAPSDRRPNLGNKHRLNRWPLKIEPSRYPVEVSLAQSTLGIIPSRKGVREILMKKEELHAHGA